MCRSINKARILVLAAAVAACACHVTYKKAIRKMDVVLVRVVGEGVHVVEINNNPEEEKRRLAHLKKSVNPQSLSEKLVRGVLDAGGMPRLPFNFTASPQEKMEGTLMLHVEKFGFTKPKKGPAELFFIVRVELQDKKGRPVYKKKVDCTSKGIINLFDDLYLSDPAAAGWQDAVYAAGPSRETLPEVRDVPLALQGLSHWCGVRVVKVLREDWN